jgi:hypothetical protein
LLRLAIKNRAAEGGYEAPRIAIYGADGGARLFIYFTE